MAYPKEIMKELLILFLVIGGEHHAGGNEGFEGWSPRPQPDLITCRERGEFASDPKRKPVGIDKIYYKCLTME